MVVNIFSAFVFCFSIHIFCMEEESFSDQENKKIIQLSAEINNWQYNLKPTNEFGGQESLLLYELGFVQAVEQFLSAQGIESKATVNSNPSVAEQNQASSVMTLRSGKTKTDGRNNKAYPSKRKIYLCRYKFCDKSYNKKQYLDAHVRLSHQQVTYRCLVNTCGEIFNDSHKRTCHTKKEHPEESKNLYPFACVICHERFAKINYLTVHNNRYKGDCK